MAASFSGTLPRWGAPHERAVIWLNEDPTLSVPTPDPPINGAPHGLNSTDFIVGQLASTDTPFRAWAAVALLTAANARHREEGQRVLIELADLMPQEAELQHADLAAYAMLDGAGYLSPEQQARLRSALPRPHADHLRRARIFESGTYTYLLARGVGTVLPWARDLVHHVDYELEGLTDRVSPDLVEVALLLAARIELAATVAVSEDALRRVRGRVAGAENSRLGGIALQWLLEVYHDRWPKGDDAGELLLTARRYVGRAASGLPPTVDDRVALLVMQLETLSRREAEYRLISRTDEEAATAARLGRRRWTEAAAYLLCVVVLSGGPMVMAVNAGWFDQRVGWAGALGVGLPAAVWALLVVLGRAPEVTVIGGSLTLGLLYFGAALYAGRLNKVAWLTFLADEGALIELVVAAVASIWAGVSARRRR